MKVLAVSCFLVVLGCALSQDFEGFDQFDASSFDGANFGNQDLSGFEGGNFEGFADGGGNFGGADFDGAQFNLGQFGQLGGQQFGQFEGNDGFVGGFQKK